MSPEYNKKVTNHKRRGFIPVKERHLGPRQKNLCLGDTLRIREGDQRKYRQGEEIDGYCLGCGFIGRIQRKG